MQPVNSWSCPTQILIGSAAEIVPALKDVFVVADPAVNWDADMVREPGETDGRFIERIRASRRGRTLVAIGGGSVLDPARVAVAGVPYAGDGPVLLPASPTAFCDLVCVPSTIGTAAEVSPVAVVRERSMQAMLVSPALRARMAILDPDVTDNPDEALMRAGLVEPWARAIVPVVDGQGLCLQDALAHAVAAVLAELATADIDRDWRLTAALASAQTHTAFLALQRPAFSHVLWPVVTELVGLTGISKQHALSLLLPGWLESRGRADLATTVRTAWPVPAITVNTDELNVRVGRRWQVFGAPVVDWL